MRGGSESKAARDWVGRKMTRSVRGGGSRSEATYRVRRLLRAAVAGLRHFAYAGPRPKQGPQSPVRRPRLGLALGGGFARGLAHVGVLKLLQANRIPIDALAGTSAGAIAAAALACGRPLDELMEQAKDIRWSSVGRWTIPSLGFATNQRMERMLVSVLGCTRFEELKIPLAVVAADICTGETAIFRRCDLIQPIRASCSVPGLFVPVEIEGRMLVDGAIVSNVPVGALRDFDVDVKVAISLGAGERPRRPKNLFQVVGNAFQIAEAQAEQKWRRQCDLVIEPDVAAFDWDDFEHFPELVRAGEVAARRSLPALRALLEGDRRQESGVARARSAAVP
jgi:NTE family protein